MALEFADDQRPKAVEAETALFDGEAVVFLAATRSIHRLNATAGAVWVCCDGDTPVAAMIDELADVFGVSTAEGRPQVLEALGQLHELGLLASHPLGVQTTITAVSDHAPDGSRIIGCPPDT